MEQKSFKVIQPETFSTTRRQINPFNLDIASGSEPVYTYFRPNTRVRDRTKVYKCHLCLHRRNTYFCQECVRNGNFTHSVSKNLERFADKKLKYYGIQETKTELSNRIANVICRKKQYLELKFEIQQHKENILHLRRGIEDTNQVKSKDKERVEQLRKQLADLFSQDDRNKRRLSKIQRFNGTCKENVSRKRFELCDLSNSLQCARRERILTLTTHIFPIYKIEHNGSSEEALESSESSSSNDSYLLVPFQNREDSHYRILESVLPSSGDYSQYHDWLSRRKDSVTQASSSSAHMGMTSGRGLVQELPESLRNPAYCISSALTHAAQLVAALAHILDINLPKTVCYSAFCGSELSRDQFAFKVGKLNANVVYLCLSQGVEPALIDSPKSTLKNLTLLLHCMPSQLGRCSPISVEAHSLLQSWPYGGEDEFTDLALEGLLEEEFFSGGPSSLDQQGWQEEDEEGWEEVPEGLPTDPFSAVPTRGSPSGTISVQSQSQARSALTQTTDTIGGGLMSSVASFWRAAVGGQK